jgi:Ca2+-binding EF-hand superfamily protein
MPAKIQIMTAFLTLDELLKRPLASFDCMDENHDGKVTKDEQFTSMDRCPSVNLDDYAPKP